MVGRPFVQFSRLMRPPSISHRPAEQGEAQVVCVEGDWSLPSLNELERLLDGWRAGAMQSSNFLAIDCSRIGELDSSGANYLLLLSRAGGSELPLQNLNMRQEILVNLVRTRASEVTPVLRLPVLAFVPAVGRSVLLQLRHLRALVDFLGELTVHLGHVLMAGRVRAIRVRECVAQCEQTLLSAILIVALLTFLIGVVVAYLFASQSVKYGGNIFIVDAVSISMCRELAPILAAILVAGRSGSAFTAQIGTMKMNDEVDALRAMGLSPLDVLVIPRLIALVIAMPLLVFVGDLAGILGGVLIADLYLEITPATFIERMQRVLQLRHVYIGLVKAPVFAIFVAIIGCYMGLASERNAASVGQNTTSTVVQSIVAVILLNAAFAVALVEMKL